jgi:LPS sulfotransferase NodH
LIRRIRQLLGLSFMARTSPRQSYVIWFSQRVGSTLLAQALEDTGIAGHPREWLNAPTAPNVLANYKVANVDELRTVVWRDAQTQNGVLGIKYGMVPTLHEDLTSLFAPLAKPQSVTSSRAGWDAFFPNCKHLFLTRRDKVRLAVSWWRAIKSGEWHRPNRSSTLFGPIAEATSTTTLLQQYDDAAIEHLIAEANRREEAMQEQFTRWDIIPNVIVYEEFIDAYEPTVRAVLEFLQIPCREQVAILPPAFDRLADEVSEAWVQRFLHEYPGTSG